MSKNSSIWNGDLTMHDLIKTMGEHQVFPYLEDGKLKTRSTSKNLPQELIALIKQNKEGLIEYLKSAEVKKNDDITKLQADYSDLPLSFNQERLWLTNQIDEGSAQYNIATAFKLTGTLDLAAFQSAFDTLINRHEVLRTQFVDHFGECQLRLADVEHMPIAMIDLCHMDDAEQQQRVFELAKAEAAKPFDLANDLMLRLTLLKLSSDTHILLFTQHHIASDGWSIGILVKEFSALYSSQVKGLEIELPEQPVRYVDFAKWQRDKLSGENLDKALDFWRAKLKQLPKLHNLPLDYVRPAKQTYTGKRINTRLDSELGNQLKRLAERHNATLFMVLQCAYALLIAKYSGDDDVVIGSPIAGRNHASTESLVGFFANALVYRNQLEPNDTFETLLARCKAYSAAVFEYQDMPFSLLVKELEKTRSLAYAPIFQLSFTMQNNEQVSAELENLEIDYIAVEQSKTLFDLSLFATESEDSINLEWLYYDKIFSHATITNLATAFAVLVQKICHNPMQSLSEISIVEQANQPLSLQQDERIETQVHRVFEQQVEQSPDAPALYFEDTRWSYSTLNQEANRLAHYLLSKGVTPSEKVGILVERSAEMILATLGVLKSGAAYIPLDPSLPSNRLEYMIEDAGITTLITQQSLMNSLDVEFTTTILIDQNWRSVLFKNQSSDNLDNVLQSADDLAYVIYTSGSTGQPKGVMISHRGLVNNSFAQQAFYQIDASSNVMQFVSFSFDVATSDWASALTCGAQLTILNEQQRTDIEMMAQVANAQGVTHLQLPAAVLAQLNCQDFHTLHTLILGGSQANQHLVKCWQEQGRKVINAYGPTEGTVATSACYMAEGVSGKNIGQAFPNLAYLVVDKNLQPIQPGGVGELLITGAGLAIGYLNQPALTDSAFIQLVVGDEKVRFYRTGDLVKLCQDSSCEFVGRMDDQVKLRGFRVELGEIEIALRSLSGVKDVAVCVNQVNDTQQLAAYFVAENPVAPEQTMTMLSQWRQQLEGMLPDYMIPNASMIVAELPLTANGKVDKEVLPSIDVSAQVSTEYVAPRNEIESLFCDIWQSLLKVEKVGINDNFFALGGDSIISIQVVARAKQAGVTITTKQLFAHQTISELAVHAELLVDEVCQEAVVGEQTLLPIQQQFLSQSNGQHNHFNQSVLLVAPAALTLADCHKITSAIYQRHDVLRLVFKLSDRWQASYQTLTDELISKSCEQHELPQTDFSNHVEKICAEAQSSFDISQGPLFKMLLLSDGQQQRLFIVAHHLVVDGVSWRILLSDIEQAYEQLCAQKAVSLGSKTTSYQDWGAQLAALGNEELVQNTKSYWQTQTQQAELLPREMYQEQPLRSSNATVPISLTKSQTTALLSQCSHAYSTQVNELLLSAVVLGLKRWSHLNSFNIVLEGHGREDIVDGCDLTETLGWFTSTYPLYVKADSTEISRLIIQCKEQLRAVPNKGLSYGILQYLTQELPVSPYKNAVAFNYLGQFDQSVNQDTAFQLAAESTGKNIGENYPRIYSLGLNGKVMSGKLNFNLDYSKYEYRPETMRELGHHIQQAILDIISHCQDCHAVTYTPSDFPLVNVTQAELNQWQSQFNIQNIYPATPMQKGMLYHSQLDKGAYISQALPLLKGELKVQWLEQAWQHVVAQFDIFRTAFVGQGDHINQVVLSHATMEWAELDWRELTPAQQQKKLDELVVLDRRKGFLLASAPLQRMTVVRVANDAYQLLWTHHHALIDGWCSGLVYQAVLTAYGEIAAGHQPGIQKVPQYQKYIEWLVNKDLSDAKAFWRSYLSGIEHATDLAILSPGKPRAEDQRMLTLEFSTQQTKKLQDFASQHTTTVNTLLQFVWGYLLHRYSGDESVVFGTPVSGRPPEVDGIEQMVGLFINSVPVRVDFADGDDIPSKLKLMQQQFQQCNEFGYAPLTEIQAQTDVAMGASLFNSMFIFENYPLDVALNETAEEQALPFSIDAYQSFEGAAYPLALSAALREQLKMKLYYDSSSVDSEAIQRLLEQLETLITQVVDNIALEDLELMPASQQQQLKVWREQISKPIPEGSMGSWFTQLSAQYAERTALVCGEELVSYAELERYSNQFARQLIEFGVGIEDKVAILLDRNIESFIALIGILKAGAAYVPIDMSNPKERIEYILEASNSQVIVSAKQHLDIAEQLERPVLVLEKAQLNRFAQTPPQTSACPENLAYIIFTSGSTGQPKGVMIEHKGLLNLVHNDVERYEVTPESKLLHCTSMGFDAGTAHMFKVLGGGGELHIVEPHSELENYIEAQQITHLALPVARLEMMNRRQLSSLKVLITGADVVSASLVNMWAPQCKFFNVYGPTEITIAATTGEMHAGQAVTIGTANNNYYLYVLDSQQRELPQGVAGELYVGGVGVARGYVGQQALTEERFIDNPFADPNAPRLYRTGDMVRVANSGALEFVGRIDQQVKIRGYRIELSEIKALVQQYKNVKEVNVGVYGAGADKKLVCHYSTSHGEEYDFRQFRSYLIDKLPEYMLPAYFIHVSKMPLTPNGKIDLKALPEPDFEKEQSYVAPTTETERKIVTIWEACLDIEKVGIDSNFFELGGNSLHLAKVLHEINAEFNLQLELKALFDALTVSSLSKLIESQLANAAVHEELEEGVL